MKNLLCFILLLSNSIVSSAQNERILSFLKDVNNFVTVVELADSISYNELNIYKETMMKYNNLYDSIYSKEMNNKQIEIYSSYKSRYYKKMSKVKATKVTNKIDSVGQNIDNKIQTGVSNIFGTLKGIFSKQK